MQWLLVFLGGIVEKIFSWFFKRGLKNTGLILSYTITTLGLYITFILTTTALLWALEPVTPDIVPFALSIIPPVGFNMLNMLFTARVAKRVFEYHKQTSKDFTQAMLL